ncbi:hypothetical protein SEPCBS57363_002040 [Sporothrix epigloea]|uniref:AAA+ ATPase domain-containing protein n=1 Tax=Sporothrix epigloea TaxID=1892477 RepID=A0ABP0DDM4_9PEZI
MASEPPGEGRQKKLHPLFAPQKAASIDGSKSTEAGAPRDGGLAYKSPTPGTGNVPAAMNAFDMLKKKSVDLHADPLLERIPQAAEPKRRGRLPKKQSSSPPPPSYSSQQEAESPKLSRPWCDDNNSRNLSGACGSSYQGTTVPVQPLTTSGSESIDLVPPIKAKTCLIEPPKRILRLNPKTGTIGSPPNAIKSIPSRPYKAKGKAASVRAPLVIPYPSQDDASRSRIGHLIDSILSSKIRMQPQNTPNKSRLGLSATPTASGDTVIPNIASMPKSATTTMAKTSHPFFTGVRKKGTAAKDGPAEPPASAIPSSKETFVHYYTSTPCSPRKRGSQAVSALRMPQFGAKNGILRVPGARLPAWPWMGAVHVHPDGYVASNCSSKPINSLSLPPPRKQKGLAITIRDNERILEQKKESLNIASVVQDIRNANADEFMAPPPELRLPQRHIESGRKLQARITPQLRTNDPGLNALFTSISSSLSAFDQHHCESLSWAQKYAPSCAIEVLQSGQEPVMIRKWLEALKVDAVDTGSVEGDVKGAAAGGARGRPKKKRKKNKLDGFIVSSDDEDDGTGERSDNEADWAPSGRYGLTKNTVVRSSIVHGARLTNAIVISGPHGCGKSAAVYAVAKELGFEVFEINASSRRSGKDVVERIGDMTRNHLVHHRKRNQPKTVVPTDIIDPTDDYDMDLDDADGEPDPDFPMPEEEAQMPTSKQPTMGFFFKPTSGAPGKQDQLAEPKSKAIQKQSLIFLEEADLLYEEDKQFWATVMSLMAQSKRPFVITCNDETLLPLQSLMLHAIFRFTPPPADVAVDRLILIAASEGHALQREAVQSLYEVRNHDFRAALVDLQFWCQIGVGDRRGGFDWFYQRWPDGVDLDENADVMRVVSADTFQEGMGWLTNGAPTGTVKSANSGKARLAERSQIEMHLVQQTWENWQLDMGQWHDSLDLASWASRLPFSAAKADSRQLLEAYAEFTEAMSDADLVSSMVFSRGNLISFDATQPELPYKAHEDYILGQQLLEQTTVAHELDDLRLPMATAIRCAAKRTLLAGANLDNTMAASTLDTLNETRIISSIRKEHSKSGGVLLNDTPIVRRIDFSLAFDPIAVPSSSQPSSGLYVSYFEPSTTTTTSSHLDPSVCNNSMKSIAVDVAPFVRGIIAYEDRLQKYRKKTSSFVTESSPTPPTATVAGATSGSDSEDVVTAAAVAARRRTVKRQRTTRTAQSALEWGSRSTFRRKQWFENTDINPALVMRTGGDGWDGIVEGVLKELTLEAAAADARDEALAAARAAEEKAAAKAAAKAARVEAARLKSGQAAEATVAVSSTQSDILQPTAVSPVPMSPSPSMISAPLPEENGAANRVSQDGIHAKAASGCNGRSSRKSRKTVDCLAES